MKACRQARSRGATGRVAASAALCLLAAALMLLAAAPPRAAAADFGGRGAPNPLPCQCTDVDARVSFTDVVNYTCWEQYKFGKCVEPFMLDAIKEVPEGYCQISCGRCACCPSLAAAAQGAGLAEFLWALNRSASHVEPLQQPGLMATLLAPEDGAMRSLFDKLGGKERIEAEEGVRAKLAGIMAYHVVRPLPGYEAWTTPFLTPGTTLQTYRNGSTLRIAESGDSGAIKVQGAGSSAEVQRRDIYACKGFINTLNWFLLPPGEQLDGA